MIGSNTILIWLVLLNWGIFVLFIWSKRVLPKGKTKSLLLSFLVGYSCWINPLLGIHLCSPNDHLIDWFGKFILIGGCLFVVTLGRFVIGFSNPKMLGSIINRIFEINFFLLFCLAIGGLLEEGVAVSEFGLAPIKGPLMPLFDISVTLYGLFFLFIAGRAYYTTDSDILRAQLRAIYWTCLPSFLIGLFTNAVFPALTGNFQLTPTGGLWLLFFFVGIIYVIVSGRRLLVQEKFRRLVKHSSVSPNGDLSTLKQVVDSLAIVANTENKNFDRSLDFGRSDESSRIKRVTIRTLPILPSCSDTYSSNVTTGDSEIFHELDQSFAKQSRLQTKNVLLTKEILFKQGEFRKYHQEYFGDSERSFVSEPESEKVFELNQFIERIDENIERNRGGYGQTFLSFSPSLRTSLQRVASFADLPGSILLEGETGVGKSLFASIAHSLRGGEGLEPIYCDSLDSEELIDRVEKFFERRELGSKKGLLLKHFDLFASGNKEFYYEFFAKKLTLTNLVYFTVSPGYKELVQCLPADIKNSIFRNHVHISPLRDRPEDIFHQMIWGLSKSANKIGYKLDKSYFHIIESAKERNWQGNTRQLLGFCSKKVVEDFSRNKKALHPSFHAQSLQLSESVETRKGGANGF